MCDGYSHCTFSATNPYALACCFLLTMPKLYTSLAVVALPPRSTSGACMQRSRFHLLMLTHSKQPAAAAIPRQSAALPGPEARPTSQIGLVAAALVRLLSGRAPSSSLDRLKSGVSQRRGIEDLHGGRAETPQPAGQQITGKHAASGRE